MGRTPEILTTEIEAKSILRKPKKIDSWFISAYGMNLYRGCQHDCVYCDGRAERYRVSGDFGREIGVKTSAVEVLARELDIRRKRKPFRKGYLMIGGGVGDSYQQAEEERRLTRRVLELVVALEHTFPVHVLTKSTLVLRDLDLLEQINRRSRVIVSFSISSACDETGAVFEPGAALPTERLGAIARLRSRGIACGVFLMPVIPFVTDTDEQLAASVAASREAGADFVIFGGMTLKDGRQRDHFTDTLRRHHPELVDRYAALYRGDRWGNASGGYYERTEAAFARLSREGGLPRRVPPALYMDLLSENDRVVVALEHLDYLHRLHGRPSSFGRAAYSVSRLAAPISDLRGDLRSLRSVGWATERIILELLDTGRCALYEELL